MPTNGYEAVIIGGGPAGLSAALVLGRCRRRVLLCDGGRYRNERSQALHCYMGHDGIAPARLLEVGRAQLVAYDNVEYRSAVATRIAHADAGVEVAFAEGAPVTAKKLLVATGVVDEVPDTAGVAELFGRSIHVCPYCDGWEHRDAPIAVWGRGTKGGELARLLRQWTSDLALCTDGPAELPNDLAGQLAVRGIGIYENRIARLEGEEGRLRQIVFTDGQSLARRALFLASGQHPRSPLLTSLGCAFDEKGGVVSAEDGETSVSGVYVAGDVSRDVQLAIIAAAEGARAALAINKALISYDSSRGGHG